MKKKTLLIIVLLSIILSACGSAAQEPTPDMNLVALALATVNASFTQTAQAIPTNTSAPTETPIPPTPTQFVPTTILTVVVKIAANLRFGPSTVYAGPGGARSGKVLEAIGRDASGKWLLVRDPGGKKSSWVNIISLDIQGDLTTLAIAPVELIFTPNYPAPSNIAATRNGDQVTITWADVPLQPKAVHLGSHYFLEVWLCNAGALTYTILSTNDLFITVTDQIVCAEASHGLLYTATREGYSQPAAIPWP